MFEFRCDECGAVYQLPDEANGQHGKCKCGALMLIRREAAPVEPEPIAEAEPVVVAEEDDGPDIEPIEVGDWTTLLGGEPGVRTPPPRRENGPAVAKVAATGSATQPRASGPAGGAAPGSGDAFGSIGIFGLMLLSVGILVLLAFAVGFDITVPDSTYRSTDGEYGVRRYNLINARQQVCGMVVGAVLAVCGALLVIAGAIARGLNPTHRATLSTDQVVHASWSPFGESPSSGNAFSTAGSLAGKFFSGRSRTGDHR